MFEPPLLAGALQDTFAVVPPVAVAETLCGALGTVAATAAVALELAAVLPNELVAVTTQRIALPTSALTNVYVLDVAPEMLELARCH
jgi:Mg2+/Co2+ transporter CorB